MKYLSAYLLLMVASVVLTGCGKLSLSVGGQTLQLPEIFRAASGSELVSGAARGVATLHNYTVDSTVGVYNSQIESSTTNGYTVYQGVQGLVVSE